MAMGCRQKLLLVDRASQLTLSATEMTVLLGGLRVLGANHGQSPLGVFTSTPGSLTTDFFINLLDTGTEWVPRTDNAGRPTTYEGRDRRTGEVKWIASRVDLAFRATSGSACTLGGLRQPGRSRRSSYAISCPRGSRS